MLVRLPARTSLRVLFAVVAAGSAAVIMVASGLVGVTRERARLDHLVREHAEVVLALVTALATPALMTYDYDSLDPAMQLLQRDREVLEAVVRDGAGKVIRHNARKPGPALEVTRPVMAAGQKVGDVRLALSLDAVNQAVRRAWLMTALQTTVAFVLLSGVIYGAFALLVQARLARLAQSAERLAAGDLTAPIAVDRPDEIGALARTFVTLRDRLHEVISQVTEAALAVSVASSELSASGAQLSERAQEQATSVEETASSLAEVTATVKKNVASAQEAAQMAASYRDAADRGGEAVAATVTSIREMTEASRRVADIVAIIDDIAFQTNLLAINAAVEAARAGEHGRGFAVVAAEVRQLAGKSAAASNEIKALIRNSIDRVETGSGHVEGTLQEIVRTARRVADVVGEIVAVSRGQAEGIDQAHHAVGAIEGAVQRNAADMKDISATAEGLEAQAHRLEGLVTQFRLEPADRTPSPDPPAPRPAPASSRAPAHGVVRRGPERPRRAAEAPGVVHAAGAPTAGMDVRA